MELSDFAAPEMKNDADVQCPVCGSEHFQAQALDSDGRFVTRICSECGLVCRVVVGPESPSMEVLNSEWVALFARD
jgi:transcription elongation factor Elf1